MTHNSYMLLVVLLLVCTGGIYTKSWCAQEETKVICSQCEAWVKEFWRALSRHDKNKIVLLCNVAQHLRIYQVSTLENIRKEAFLYIDSFGPHRLGEIPGLSKFFAHGNLMRLLA